MRRFWFPNRRTVVLGLAMTAAAPAALAQQAPPAVDPDSTLAGKPGDPVNVDEVTLPDRTALIVAGKGTWDSGFETLRAAITQLRAAAQAKGLAVAGRPLAHFIETDDDGFRFEAMLPVDRAPADLEGLTGIRSGATPTGRALRFVHRGAYEDIEPTYEGITAYLDAKGVTIRDQFIEEYVNDPRDQADDTAEVNIYVQPR
jgi:effector-binding domain-containing protein